MQRVGLRKRHRPGNVRQYSFDVRRASTILCSRSGAGGDAREAMTVGCKPTKYSYSFAWGPQALLLKRNVEGNVERSRAAWQIQLGPPACICKQFANHRDMNKKKANFKSPRMRGSGLTTDNVTGNYKLMYYAIIWVISYAPARTALFIL